MCNDAMCDSIDVTAIYFKRPTKIRNLLIVHHTYPKAITLSTTLEVPLNSQKLNAHKLKNNK